MENKQLNQTKGRKARRKQNPAKGAYLRYRINAAGLTVEEFAKKQGVTFVHMSRIIKGERKNRAVFMAIAKLPVLPEVVREVDMLLVGAIDGR